MTPPPLSLDKDDVSESIASPRGRSISEAQETANAMLSPVLSRAQELHRQEMDASGESTFLHLNLARIMRDCHKAKEVASPERLCGRPYSIRVCMRAGDSESTEVSSEAPEKKPNGTSRMPTFKTAAQVLQALTHPVRVPSVKVAPLPF